MKMGKRLLVGLLTLLLLLSLTSVALAKNVGSGFCGDKVSWAVDTKGILTIKGSGNMKNYTVDSVGGGDFRAYAEMINTANVEGSVNNIGDRACQSMKYLKSVSLAGCVKRIGAFAFKGCILLNSLTLTDGLNTIGEQAFAGCTNLRKVTLPSTVTTIEKGAFSGSMKLKTVEILSKTCTFSKDDCFPYLSEIYGYEGSTAQAYAAANGLKFHVIEDKPAEATTTPASTSTTTAENTNTDSTKCPLCGQTHEGFPDSLIGGIHQFIYALLMLLGMRK